MNTKIKERLAADLSALEETLFVLHRDNGDHAEKCALGVAWISVKEAREALNVKPTAPTQPPAPLAGGTTAALTQAAGHWCKLCGRGPMYSWEHTGDVCKVCVPAEVAAGYSQEGRSVSPATGEREAELRAAICLATDPCNITEEHRHALIQRLVRALTRELAELRTDRDNMAHDLKNLRDLLGCDGSDWPQLKAAVEALRTLVAKMSETAKAFITWGCPLFKDRNPQTAPELLSLLDALALTPATIADELAAKEAQFTAAHEHMDKLREHRNDLDAACHEMEGRLRESEAARGEDKARLDWLEANAGAAWSIFTTESKTIGVGWVVKWQGEPIRAAIDLARRHAEGVES